MLEKQLSKLTVLQRDLFDRTHKSHLASMGAAMKEKHSKENIKAIKWDKKEFCLKVYFNHGEWYCYYSNGSWG
ncbi:hypothetical protein [Niallia circulans]|uniref:Uncharacterized protein n=1 Tax=Niallia circulans TaxID=1397 RepID=A0A941GED1_NIACI|nr:hypothetical protein [Niallia circulans]MCB5238913.1 hypothetical protein [Niallia circulans]